MWLIGLLGCGEAPPALPPSVVAEVPAAGEAHADGHGPGGHGAEGHGPGFTHSFEGAEAWSAKFDDPARDAWQQPDALLAALALPPAAVVADLGAGTGYFSVRLARLVPEGKVFAVDLEPDMLRFLTERALKEGLTNLTPVQATADDPRLPEPVDLLLVVDTYHHLGDRTAYFRKVHDQLRPDGRVVVVDFTKDAPEGPPVEHRLPPEQVTAELVAAGFHPLGDVVPLPRQYALAFGR